MHANLKFFAIHRWQHKLSAPRVCPLKNKVDKLRVYEIHEVNKSLKIHHCYSTCWEEKKRIEANYCSCKPSRIHIVKKRDCLMTVTVMSVVTHSQSSLLTIWCAGWSTFVTLHDRPSVGIFHVLQKGLLTSGQKLPF